MCLVPVCDNSAETAAGLLRVEMGKIVQPVRKAPARKVAKVIVS